MDTQEKTTVAETTTVSEAPEKLKLKTKKFKLMAGIVGALLIILISFAAGVGVGLRKARYSYQWGQNYERNFMGGPRSGMIPGGMMGFLGGMEGRDFRNAHGLAGTIISITGNNLVIKDRDNKENTVAVTDKTIIKSGPNNLKLSDLQQNEQLVVVGNPDASGVINADLIRVFGQSQNAQPQNQNGQPQNIQPQTPNAPAQSQ
jgi:hypothetical protein